MDKVANSEGTIKSCVRRGKKTRVVIDIDGKFVPTDKHVYIMTDPTHKTLRQLNFFHAVCKDIGRHIGEHFEDIKSSFKDTVGVGTLKYATRGEMVELIDLAIEFCKKHHIPLSKKTVHQMDAEKHIDLCNYYGVCLVCGKPRDTHHIDVIGMGRDRVKVDKLYPHLKKVPLCREHHTEIETGGVEKFIKRNHLQDYVTFFERSGSDIQSPNAK